MSCSSGNRQHPDRWVFFCESQFRRNIDEIKMRGGLVQGVLFCGHMRRKKVIMIRKTTIDKADDSFDLEFWQRVGPQGIFLAMCDMVQNYFKLGGRRVHSQRLRRHVAVFKRREG